MTSFDGQSITYDSCGNMLTRGTRTYTWAQGKQLASVSNDHTISYQYDHNGMRVRKTVDGVVTDFRLNGDRIISCIRNARAPRVQWLLAHRARDEGAL